MSKNLRANNTIEVEADHSVGDDGWSIHVSNLRDF